MLGECTHAQRCWFSNQDKRHMFCLPRPPASLPCSYEWGHGHGHDDSSKHLWRQIRADHAPRNDSEVCSLTLESAEDWVGPLASCRICDLTSHT